MLGMFSYMERGHHSSLKKKNAIIIECAADDEIFRNCGMIGGPLEGLP